MSQWIALAFALALIPHPAPRSPSMHYVVRIDSADLSGWNVELRLRGLPDSFRIAMAAHQEYDDRYWRYLTGLRGESSAGPVRIEREDSAVWRVYARGGEAVLRYRLQLPAPEGPPRAAWRPFLSATGGFLGGPHTFLYVVGSESAPAEVALELPHGWSAASGLQTSAPSADSASSVSSASSASSPRFQAPNAAALLESPIFVGRFQSWEFAVRGTPHRVIYWPQPGAPAFDTTAFVSALERVAGQAIAGFGGPPYRDYTFIFQDGAYGGLEHPNSVTLGVSATELARNPHTGLAEAAHEFVHTWNLMQLRPAEYQSVSYRTQPPVAGLWWSEGLTLFYADLLLRRAGLPVADSTRIAHLERLISRYLGGPGNWRHSAETVSRVAYNAPPGSLGDYGASTHLQGEVFGAMLDLAVRDASGGARSIDDVMRLLLERLGGAAKPGFLGADIERAVEEVCGCDVTAFFDAHVRGGGKPIDFDRYLAPLGLRARVTWGPATFNGQAERDLRIFAWMPPGGTGPRLIISDAGSIWGRAGFHTGDDLLSVNGAAATTWPEFRAQLVRLQMGDTLRLTVRRAGGGAEYSGTVRVTGFERPTVRIEELPGATERERALRAQWLEGRPRG